MFLCGFMTFCIKKVHTLYLISEFTKPKTLPYDMKIGFISLNFRYFDYVNFKNITLS